MTTTELLEKIYKSNDANKFRRSFINAFYENNYSEVPWLWLKKTDTNHFAITHLNVPGNRKIERITFHWIVKGLEYSITFRVIDGNYLMIGCDDFKNNFYSFVNGEKKESVVPFKMEEFEKNNIGLIESLKEKYEVK